MNFANKMADGKYPIPSKPEGVITINKTRWISARLTKAEYNTILRNARREGLNLSAYTRKRALEAKISIIDDLKPYTLRLREVGHKLNHGIMLAHQGKINYIDLTEVETLLSEILETLHRVKEERKLKIREIKIKSKRGIDHPYTSDQENKNK